jgi:hypothetical protein
MLNPNPLGRRASALVSQHGSGSHPLLLDEIISQGERRAKVLPAMRRPVLRKVLDGFQGEIGVGD